MKTPIFALALLGAAAAWGQQQSTVPDYLGPEVLSRGASGVGQRAGKDVDLRFYAEASGIYDTGLAPVSVDGNGKLVHVGGLYGVELGLGAYGRHAFRHSVLGIDFGGTYRHYTKNPYFDGANQQFTLGYSWQKSQRVIFEFQQTAGTSAYASSLTGGLPLATDAVDDSTLLFDNRTTFFGSKVDMTYIKSARTSYTIGGTFDRIFRQSKALIGVRGYGLHGSVQHRFSARSTAGFSYQRNHYEFPGIFGGSDIDNFSGSYSRQFGRSWFISVAAGFYHSQVEGVSQVALEPALALLLGVRSVVIPFYRVNFVPSGRAELQRRFRNAVWSVSYDQRVTPGNGVYLTSRQDRADTGFSYSGIRKFSFALRGGYSRMGSLGETLPPYSQYIADTNVTYAITDAFHLTAGFGAMHQEIDGGNFNRNATRTTIGIAFSPGNIPISFR